MPGISFQLDLFLAPLFLGGAILAMKGWRREMWNRKQRAAEIVQENAEEARRRRLADARLPANYAQVFSQREARQLHPELTGYYMLVAVGTFGVNEVTRVLLLLYLCGLDKLVGSILVIENNEALRREFPKNIPEVFHDRVIYGFSRSFVGGFSNKPTMYVLEYQDEWGGPIRRAAIDAAELHERRTGHIPAQILAYLSLGGSAPTGSPAIEYLAGAFRHTQIVGFTSLPEHERNRLKFAELKAHYDNKGVVGWVVSDKLKGDWVNADFCMAALVVAPAAAQLHDDQSTQLNNIFTLAFTENPGGILVFQYVHTSVVASAWVVEDEVLGYQVTRQSVTEKTLQALRDVERDMGHYSASMPIGQSGTSTFDLVMTSLGVDIRHARDDLQTLRDEINEGNTLRLNHLLSNGGRQTAPRFLYGLANYEMVFGSLATQIVPNKPSCPIIVLRLSAVKDGAERIVDLVKVPSHLLPPPMTPILTDSNDKVEGPTSTTNEEEFREQSPTTSSGDTSTTARRGRPRKDPNG